MQELLPQLSGFVANSLMKNEFNFTLLLEKLCASIAEIAMYFDHPSFVQIIELMREHREDVTRIIFKNMHEKNSIILNHSKTATTGDSLSEMLAKLESKNREIESRIGYFTTRAKQFEQFLSKKEVM